MNFPTFNFATLNKKIKIAAIVPAYNEEKAIAAVVNDINHIAETQNLSITVLGEGETARRKYPSLFSFFIKSRV